jgi:hypothetical protein
MVIAVSTGCQASSAAHCSTTIIQPTPKRSATILAERHLHLAAVGERLEHTFGIGFILWTEGQREALELRLALGAAVGRQHRRAIDAKRRTAAAVKQPRDAVIDSYNSAPILGRVQMTIDAISALHPEKLCCNCNT